MSKYTHIFFDLDHTLWDFRTNSIETLHELYETFDLGAKGKSPSAQFFVERYVHHNERMWALYRENRMSKSRLRKARFEAALRDIGLEDKRFAKRLGEAYLELCPRKTKLNDGAIEVVAELSGHATLHILTNGFHETQLTKLECSGLRPYFDQVITSEKASARKPQERMFRFAEQLTSAPKNESIMVGDSLEIDVIGAVEFGWDAIHFNEFDQEHSFLSVKKLEEIPALVIGKAGK